MLGLHWTIMTTTWNNVVECEAHRQMATISGLHFLMSCLWKYATFSCHKKKSKSRHKIKLLGRRYVYHESFDTNKTKQKPL